MAPGAHLPTLASIPNVRVVFLLAAIAILLYIPVQALIHQKQHSRRASNFGCSKALRYPHREPFFGLDLLLNCAKALRSHNFLDFNRKAIIDVNTTFEYLVLGNRAVVTIDPEVIRIILSTQFRNFDLGDTRKNSLRPLFGEGIFNSDGLLWHQSRSFLRPYLSRRTESDLSIFEYHAQQLFKLLHRGQTLDIQAYFAKLTIDIATEVMLGKSSKTLSIAGPGGTGDDFAKSFDYATHAVSGIDDLEISCWITKLFYGSGRLKSALNNLNGFLEDLIDEALYESKNGGLELDGSEKACTTVLEGLLREKRTKEDIKCQLLNLLLAGRDTSTSLLSHVWFVLARYPQVLSKLYTEIKVLEGKAPTAQGLEGMKYLRYVVNETLRLYPPVPLNQRTARVDTTIPLGGGPDGQQPMFVAKGTSIGYSVYAMHRRQDIFGTDSEEFRPERWETLRPGWAYLPFHAGPRTCLGQRFALQMTSFITVRMLQQYSQVECRDDREWQESLGLNCFSRHGVRISLG